MSNLELAKHLRLAFRQTLDRTFKTPLTWDTLPESHREAWINVAIASRQPATPRSLKARAKKSNAVVRSVMKGLDIVWRKDNERRPSVIHNALTRRVKRLL